MEERKHHHLTKKVRFDLNEEIFLIPSKWDRLSKCKTTNARVIDGLASKHKNRTIADRRIDVKGKQSKNRKTQNISTYGKRDSNPELNGKVSDNSRPNSTPNVKKDCARKTARYKEGNENGSSGNSTPPVEGRLKFYHRPPQELPKLDLVLPKIQYTPDLKKAIEKALQRSRSRPSLETGLNNTSSATKERDPELLAPLPKDKTAERLSKRRLSDSSIRLGDEKPIEKKENQPNGEAKFSELSSNLDGWNPFSAWSSKDNSSRSNSTAPITRGRSMSSLIPSSILY